MGVVTLLPGRDGHVKWREWKNANSLYHGHRFPPAVISCAVRWHFRFQLSLRDIEELLFERGVVVSYETIRRCCDKFGNGFAIASMATRRKPGATWHLDVVFVSLRGEPFLLWRAVDQHGTELDVLLRKRRDKAAAKRSFKRALAACPEVVPPKIVTDHLHSYAAAKAEIPELTKVKPIFVKVSDHVKNQAENGHQLTRERERRMRGFRDPERTQGFLASFGPTALRAEAPSTARFRLPQTTRRTFCCVASLHRDHPKSVRSLSGSASFSLSRCQHLNVTTPARQVAS
jgi:putative transposase